MSKESERLFDLLGNVDEGMVEKAGPAKKKPLVYYRRYAGIAACFAVVFLGFSFFPRMGCGSSGGGRRDAEEFMNYFGPVLPLSSFADTPEITASRQLSFDFAKAADEEERAGQKARVKDEYTLTNTSNKDRTIGLVYPFVIASSDEADRLPVLTKDSKKIEADFAVGKAEDFGPACGKEWAELGKKNALQNALVPPQKLGRGIAYKITPDPVPNGDLHYEFGAELNADWSCSGWWSYGISASDKNGDAFWLGTERAYNQQSPQPGYIIAAGEDFKSVRPMGKSWQDDVTKAKFDPNITGTVERNETEMEPLILQLGKEYLAGCQNRYWGLTEAQRDGIFMDSVRRDAEGFPNCGVERCEPICLTRLEDFFENAGRRRLLAARFEITIPAGQSVQITAEFVRSGSHDFTGKRQEEWGYDLLTNFGGSLAINKQTLTLQNTQQIELVRDDCGFDLENGKNTVTLDPQKPVYEWVVRQKQQKK